jgi:hypothetical protein
MGEHEDDRDSDCGCGFKPWRERRSRRGDTFQFTLQVLQNAQTLEYGSVWPGESPSPNYVPVNLTGWRVVFTAKYEFPDYDSEAVAQLDNLALGGVTATGTTGQVGVAVPALATAGFPDGPVKLVYDVKVIDPSNNPHTAEIGRWTVSPSVTRAT